MRALSGSLSGHAYTVVPRLLARAGKKAPFAARVWRRSVLSDRAHGEVVLSGLLSEHDHADTLLLVLHGCGGSPDSDYVLKMARVAHEQGMSVLRIAWRGADLAGEDLYHAAQTEDLHAALSDPEFARYERVFVVGYSLGGHACLHFAHQAQDKRLQAVATVCPVLHLIETNLAIDAPGRVVYRRYTLAGLRAGYRKLHERGRAPTLLTHVERAHTFREYDALTVVPRYGFASVDDYYTRMCAARIVGQIDRPTLVVCARHDPMLPWQIAERARPRFSSAIDFRWAERGGHCLFPRDLALGERADLGLESQVLAWLTKPR